MEKLDFGSTAELDDGKEFICFGRIEENGEDYVYLCSNFKPLEVRFAKQKILNNELQLHMISDPNLKQHLLELFKSKQTLPKDKN